MRIALVTLLVAVGISSAAAQESQPYARTPARVARGRYLAEGILQCFVCHSDRDWNAPGAPPVRGRKGAGHVWMAEGKPWLVSPNLTPDRETGIGAWSDAEFLRALRYGIGRTGARTVYIRKWP